MKQILVLFISWFLSAFSYKAMAQESKSKDNNKTEEIVIRRDGDKDVNMTIQITGDKVLINGKPITEFKDDNVSVNKRNITVWQKSMRTPDVFGNFSMDEFGTEYAGDSKVVLGVTTEKGKEGAIITEVTKGSAAEKAGLKAGDIITKFAGEKVDDSQDLYDVVNKKKVNDEVKIEYKRDGKEKTATAKLQERTNRSFALTTPGGNYKAYTLPRNKMKPGTKVAPQILHNYDALIEDQVNQSMDYAFGFGKPKLGLKIQDVQEDNGVKVLTVEENSAAAKAGMKADDIITEIGGTKVSNTDEVREALHENNEKSSYKIKAKRGNNDMTFNIVIPKKLKTANL